MSRRVAVTGMAGISPIGNDWDTIRARLGAVRTVRQVQSQKHAQRTEC